MAAPASPDRADAPAWAGQHAWRVLDCAFDDSRPLLALWQALRADPQAPRMLHYVGIAPTLPALDPSHPLASEWAAACAALPHGIHRIALEGDRLSLTLCLGTDTAPDALAFQADQIVLPRSAGTADKWALKTWARCCRLGTQLTWPDPTPDALPPAWQDAGFTLDASATGLPRLAAVARFAPRWELKRTRQGDSAWPGTPGRCVVIGAGLAGASTARALALRGWQVTVLDQAAHSAAGASGLPVGLVVPHQSVDDSPRSRLSRAGIQLTLAQARAHLRDGVDWSPCGVTEMRMDPDSGQREPIWHAQAGWIKPAALVQAWLQTPGVRFQGQSPVARLSHAAGGWQLHGAADQVLAQADIVVLANAMGAKALLQALPLPEALARKLSAMHAMFGTMTLGALPADRATLPDTPVNGLGSFVPQVPSPDGAFWAAGASFESEASAVDDTTAQHAYNLQRLQTLLPDTAKALAPQFANNAVRAWRNARCVTQDRLPWVGEVSMPNQPGLWVCAGMGARGLSFSVLCAEVLAARLGAEPLPHDAALLRSVELGRVLR